MRITNNYVFFFSQHDILSNFYPFAFEHKNQIFETSEHAFMWRKAIYFNDVEIANKILKEARKPQEAKALGRKVKNYNDQIWEQVRFDIMKEIIHDKIEQFPRLETFLQTNRHKTFVEASPYDSIWGIKLDQDNPLILDESNWQGLNLLGEVFNELKEKFNQLEGEE